MSLKTIRLYGHLGERFGRIFRLDVQSPAEAVRALCVLLPGFRSAVIDDPRAAGGYRVSAGSDRRDAKTLTVPCGEGESIRIVPVMCGAGEGGLGQTILGIVMVIAGGILEQPWMVSIGWGMIVGGVVQLLAPNTNMAETGPPDRPDSKPSFAFDGAVNTAAQGNPVPVCYGRMIVGSQVISAGMSVEQL